jgi:cation transporter-like permease
VAEEKVTDLERVSLGTTPEVRRRSKRLLKTTIIGLGVILVIIGIALAVYTAMYESEDGLIVLAPAFIGVIVIIAAVYGKKH